MGRISCVAIAILAVTATLTSCADGDGSGGRVDSGRRSELVRPGLHELAEFPLDARSDPVFVWTGHELVVWGGVSVEGDSDPRRSLGDGAVLDPASGWKEMTASPNPHGLFGATGAWDGTEVVIIGSDCDESIPSATTGEPPRCSSPAALAWTPTDGTWRRLPVPPIPVDQSSGEAVLTFGARALGGDGVALFVDEQSGTTIVWNRQEQRWTSVPSPTGGALGACVDPTEPWIVAVSRPQLSGVGEEQRLYTVAPTTDRTPAWSDGVVAQAAIGSTSCGAGRVVAASGFRAMYVDVVTGAASPIPPDPTATGEPMIGSATLVGWWVLSSTTTPLAAVPTTTRPAAEPATRGPATAPIAPDVAWSEPVWSARLAPDGPTVAMSDTDVNRLAWAQTEVYNDRWILTCDLRTAQRCFQWVAPPEAVPPG